MSVLRAACAAANITQVEVLVHSKAMIQLVGPQPDSPELDCPNGLVTCTSRIVSYLSFKVTQKVSSFPSRSIFTKDGNHFVRTHENVQTRGGSSVPSILLELLQDD